MSFVAVEQIYGYKLGMWRGRLKDVDRSLEVHRFRRQSSTNCTNAIEEFQSQRFQNCFNTLDKLSDQDLTNEDLDVYCERDCTSLILKVLFDLGTYCADSGSVVSN